MVERDYSEFTPEELRLEFCKLIDLIPFNQFTNYLQFSQERTVSANPATIDEELNRRNESDYLMAYMTKIDNLLEHVYITDFFKKEIKDNLQAQFVVGIDEVDIKEGLKESFGVDDEIENIFNKDKSQIVESKIFRRRTLFTPAVAEAMTEAIDQLMKENPERTQAAQDDYDEEISEWRQEFIERYGDEP